MKSPTVFLCSQGRLLLEPVSAGPREHTRMGIAKIPIKIPDEKDSDGFHPDVVIGTPKAVVTTLIPFPGIALEMPAYHRKATPGTRS
jgi:hypothetical protein